MIRKIVNDFGVIEYNLKNTTSKLITVKIKNDGSVSVLSHSSVPIAQTEKFITSKADWIVKNVQLCKQKYAMLNSSTLDSIYILGKKYPICYIPAGQIKVAFRDGVIILWGESEKAKIKLKKLLFNFAKSYFLTRFNAIKSEIGVQEDIGLSVRNVKGWWGSCDYIKKIIKLSLRLIARDVNSIDSVIYHEFAHLKIHNHQKQFYSVLLSYCPNYYSYKKQLSDSKFDLSDKYILGK